LSTLFLIVLCGGISPRAREVAFRRFFNPHSIVHFLKRRGDSTIDFFKRREILSINYFSKEEVWDRFVVPSG
jgi:hypothetical protein